MATNTAGTNARSYPTQQTHYLFKDLVFSDNGVQKTVGIIPAGAIVTAVRVAVATLFNSSTTDLVDVGTIADPDGLAADVDVSSLGVKLPTTLATSDDAVVAVDTTIVAQYDAGAADMTTGACTVIVEFIVKQ